MPGVGRIGEVKEVNDGYGRNFLIARGLAQTATQTVVSQLVNKQKQKEDRDRKLLQKYQNLKSELDKRTFTVEVKAGDKNQIFGSVSEKDVVEKIKAKLNMELDKKQIILPRIKEIGEYQFEVKLTGQLSARPKLKVINSGENASKK